MARPASRRGLVQQAPGGTITASGGCAAGLIRYESDGLAGVLWLGLPAAMAVATLARRRRRGRPDQGRGCRRSARRPRLAADYRPEVEGLDGGARASVRTADGLLHPG